MSSLNAFYTGQLGLMHYLDPMGHFFSQHEKIAKVADLYEASPAFSNFEVGGRHAWGLTQVSLG